MTLLLLVAALSQPYLTAETERRTEPWVAPRLILRGDGFNGTDSTGPMVLFDHKCPDGIVLGAGDPYRATGSLIERVRIARQGSGGIAIKIEAKSSAERPGELIIRDVLACGLSDLQGGNPDRWETALLIDGGNDPEMLKAGVAGIRRTRIDHFRAASCLGDAIVFKNVTHLAGNDIQMDRGTSGRVPTMIIDNSRHVFLSQVNLFGELHLRGVSNVIIDGYAQTITIDSKSEGVVIRGIVGHLIVEEKALGRSEALVTMMENKSRLFMAR